MAEFFSVMFFVEIFTNIFGAAIFSAWYAYEGNGIYYSVWNDSDMNVIGNICLTLVLIALCPIPTLVYVVCLLFDWLFHI